MEMNINSETRTGRPIMADQTFTTSDRTASSSPGFEKSGEAAQDVKDQALSAGRDLKDRAKEMAESSSEAIKERASDFVDAAKGKLQQAVDGQKNAGAEYVGSLADTMRRAAREFDNDLPIAGTYIRKAASQVEVVSDSIRNGNFNDLMQGAQSFARRQPTAFLGMAVLAGFGLIRFLKSSAKGSNGGQSGWSVTNDLNTTSRADAGGQGYGNQFTR
jgi:hypothetical protein